jgi:hypothetical protein
MPGPIYGNPFDHEEHPRTIPLGSYQWFRDVDRGGFATKMTSR